jgi:UDP-2,3-diacylglucosamine pyrophosphatase LpxH
MAARWPQKRPRSRQYGTDSASPTGISAVESNAKRHRCGRSAMMLQLAFMPAPAEDFNYLVVSDLHLSEAERNPAGRFFHFDEDFADFLRHYRLSYVGQRRWRLIIDGDFIEFFQMTEAPDPTERLLRGVTLTPADRRFYPGTEWAKSVWKLDRVLRSHPQLLLALGRFLLAGNEIYVLRGNHDVEMYWPQVQEHFRIVLAQHHPADTTYLDMKAAI